MSAPPVNHGRRPFGPVKSVRFVSEHCCQRYRERAGAAEQAVTEGAVVVALEKWLDKAREVTLTPQQAAWMIIGHDRIAKFYRVGPKQTGVPRLANGDWVLVVEGDTLITVYIYKKQKGPPPAQKVRQSSQGDRIREKMIAAGIIKG